MNPPGVGVGAWAAAAAAYLVVDRALLAWVGRRRPTPAGSMSTGGAAERTVRRFSITVAALTSPRALLRRRHRVPPPGPLAMATWLDTVAAAVRTGASLREAISSSRLDGPADQHVEPLRRSIDRGDRVGDAVRRWRTGIEADDDLSVAAMALLTADEIGGAITRPLERSAAVLRRAAADADERRSWAAQARLSAVVMSALPPAVLALLVLTGSSATKALSTPIGAGVVAAGVALDALGFFWMRRIVNGATR